MTRDDRNIITNVTEKVRQGVNYTGRRSIYDACFEYVCPHKRHAYIQTAYGGLKSWAGIFTDQDESFCCVSLRFIGKLHLILN